jgi:hypothetical protein
MGTFLRHAVGNRHIWWVDLLPPALGFSSLPANVIDREEALLHRLPRVRRDQLSRFAEPPVRFVWFSDGLASLEPFGNRRVRSTITRWI